MNKMNLLGVVLLALGILALAYGGFTYTKDKDDVKIGPIHLEVTEKETVNVPVWGGVLAAVLGGVLLANRSRGRA